MKLKSKFSAFSLVSLIFKSTFLHCVLVCSCVSFTAFSFFYFHMNFSPVCALVSCVSLCVRHLFFAFHINFSPVCAFVLLCVLHLFNLDSAFFAPNPEEGGVTSLCGFYPAYFDNYENFIIFNTNWGTKKYFPCEWACKKNYLEL